mmetsp:Transcript_18188/g.27028  ORF Transcript_18188/g.27028 Transcript_18188/m.27028 type:complete len:377 (+) Transcript_18188:129-1259(+)
MPSGGSSVATDATKKKKKKKNVIKSIAKGMSFKKKKKFVDDDTVVGVLAVEPKGAGSNKAATARPAASPAAKPIQVVLLLMDPNSRRFELLQLEFDSNKALVSDVVRQVQSSATEDTLRNLSYGGVCDQDGTEMIQSLKLSNFCMGNEIVMAIPKGMSGKATLQLAQPILSDPKVADMLRPCGVKIKRINKPEKKMEKIAEEDSNETKKVTPPPPTPKQPVVSKSKSTSKTPTIFGIGIMTLLFFTILRHIRVTKKIESGDVLLPGQWKSQCGIWDVLPEKLSEKYCNTKSSSTLEMGRDGTLRYFTKSGEDGVKSESWILSGNNAAQCAESECVNSDDGDSSSATFVSDGGSWYVDLDDKRAALGKDVVQDFMSV